MTHFLSRAMLLVFFVVGSLAGMAQVSLTATSGTVTGTYTTLKGAFDKINDGTHKGIIVLKITANTTEAATASLTASATDPASAPYYTSINIYPTGTGTRTITGSLAGFPLINLNGADNVTIDGRINATGSTRTLTITNTSTSSTTGTSTIRFINDASSNTVKYCTLKGSSLDASAGIVFFSTTTGTTGNDNNTIDNNNITNNTARPLNAVYALGTSTKSNSGNTISNNNIYDFLSTSVASQGINIGSENSSFTISGNSFYETASFTATAAVNYNMILINATATGNNGFTVSGNFIGGSAALCAGTWTKTGTLAVHNNAFTAISVTTATGTANSIQGNTIQKFNWTNTGTSDFTGISLSGATVANIGTVTGNLIGAATGTGSITFTSTATGTDFFGIYIFSSGVVDCRNNTIGAITTANDVARATNFYGIFKAWGAGTTTISSNTIGSTATASSINASPTSTNNVQSVYGIQSDGTGTVTISGNTVANLVNATSNSTTTSNGLISGIYVSAGTNTISDNTVRNLSNANSNTSLTGTASVSGIVMANTTAAAQTVSGNTVFNLSNSNTSFAGGVIGIYYSGSATASTVSRNFVHSLSVSSSSTTASLYGIKIDGGAATYSNNIVSLGGTTKTTVYGIYQTSSYRNNLYFNTVYISSSSSSLASGSTNQSYALYSTGTSNDRDFRNNILVNARSTTSGSNLHYALYIAASGGAILCNHNNYFVSGTGGTLGYYGSNKTALPIVYIQFFDNDENSSSSNPTFTTPGTTAVSFTPTVTRTAATGNTGITVDYTGATRSSVTFMGALAVAATVTTTAASAVTASAASTGGNVTVEGGVVVTARGVVWSTATTPTVALSTKTSDGSSSGSFTSSITGLQASTLYYVRAYATNSAGTSYGSQITFTTAAPSAPILTTTASSALSATTVTTGGNISSDGGRTITQRGVVFGTSAAPTVALNTKTFEFNPATGAFTSQLYDLTPGTIYYARAYATNSLGTGYGNEISFTTPAQTVPAIAYGSSSPTPVTLVVGTPANLTLTNTGGMPGREQVSTYAGINGLTGSTDGIAADAYFNLPRGLAFDGSGNLYVVEEINRRIRKISPAREVSTIAGSSRGYLDGNVTDAKFIEPYDIAADPSGDLYVSESFAPRIRKITSAGVVSTLAGSGTSGFSDGTGASASFSGSADLTRDGSGNLYVADFGNRRIRKVTSSGVVTTLAGSSTVGFADGTGTAASFSRPGSICLDGSGNLYVKDFNTIRKITSSGVVTTLAGSGSAPAGVADGTGTAARFGILEGAIDADIHGNIYVIDQDNYRIRKISPGG